MKTEKQHKVLKCIASGKYKINPLTGTIYYHNKGRDEWIKKIATQLDSGYRQHILYNSKRGKESIKVCVYEHHIIYLHSYGLFDETMEIDHIDKKTFNNRVENLRLLTPLENKQNRNKPQLARENKKVRAEHIIRMIELHKEGRSNVAIGKYMGLSRVTVGYHINKFKKGEEFKYMNGDSFILYEDPEWAKIYLSYNNK